MFVGKNIQIKSCKKTSENTVKKKEKKKLKVDKTTLLFS